MKSYDIWDFLDNSVRWGWSKRLTGRREALIISTAGNEYLEFTILFFPF
jgi:hypothetical protein